MDYFSLEGHGKMHHLLYPEWRHVKKEVGNCGMEEDLQLL